MQLLVLSIGCAALVDLLAVPRATVRELPSAFMTEIHIP
jgi:hypothetical protein